MTNASVPHLCFPQPITSEQHHDAFYRWLRAKEQENKTNQANARLARLSHGRPLVVVLDDEPAVSITLCEVLRRRAINAVWFTEPLLALQYVEAGPVDLLLSNLKTPEADGIDVVARASTLQPACCIILLLKISDEEKILGQALALKLKVHIASKPITLDHLLATVQRVLHRGQAKVF